jgi:hydroxymethylpyrimidine pyrophosphatase-like HAD family hydrolase
VTLRPAAAGEPPPTALTSCAPPEAEVLSDDLEALSLRLGTALGRGDALDGFLLAAGMLQIAEDVLFGEPALLRHAARRLSDTDRLPARVAARAARAAAHAGGALAERRLHDAARHWSAALIQLVDVLADDLAGAPPDEDPLRARRSAAVLDGVSHLPDALRRSAVRRPACFGMFDQHPDDVRELAARFALAHPERDRPLLVAGVRTSGSYLAPLAGAFLRALGYTDVHVLTLRPGRRLRSDQRRLVRAVARRRGQALICDDPPGSGATVAGVARALEGHGLEVVLLLAVFGPGGALPRRLAGHAAVLLGQDDWAVTARLAPPAVRATVATLLGPGTDVLACEPLDDGTRRHVRGHVRRAYRLTMRDTGTAAAREVRIAVEGVGLGHLGADAAAIHRALEPFLPRVLGVREGLMYREWLPAQTRADRRSDDRSQVARRVAAYVEARARALPLATDRTLGARGERPAWEVASLVLSRAFGRAEPVARVLLVDPAVRRLLRVRRPSRVDGRMELSRWFAGPDGELVKADWADPIGGSRRVESCDPVSDLVQVTARSQDRSLGRLLREAYILLGHEPVDAERWLLYELVHLWNMEREDPADPEPRRAAATAMQAYMHEAFFADLEPPADGPLCAIDVDGVLELSVLGFSALTPAAARGLRALIAHGYRPLLCTGRSGPEVIERCKAYRLAGGVAEYGAVIYVAGSGPADTLLAAEETATVQRLRVAVGALDGVRTDPRYRQAVRAYRANGDGEPRRLHDDELTAALDGAGANAIRRIHGDRQTDLVLRRVDKGTGVRALAARLGVDDDPPLALAVGDSLPDVPMLHLAARAFVPAHAARAVRLHAHTTRRPWTAGFAEAVGEVIGHPAGGCPRCRVPQGGDDRRLMLALLALRESGLSGLACRTLPLRRA